MSTSTTKKPIQASDQRLTVQGNVFYNEKGRRINLQKPIRDLFQSTYKPVGYTMEVCICSDSTINRCKELLQKNIRPILMYFEVLDDEMQ